MDFENPPHRGAVHVSLTLLGRELALRLLEAVAPSRSNLGGDLAELVGRELLEERGLFPDRRYRFTLSLIQQVAYEGLLLKSRAELHARAARALEDLHAGRLEEVFLEIAEHYARSAERPRPSTVTALRTELCVSREAYKNYRWNVVLARIYDAKGDLGNAARQYSAALDNQPEMTELYDSLSDVYTRAKDYDSALRALRKAQELANDDPFYIKRVVALLEKAGRHREADAERRKLPQEQTRELSVSEQFA